MSQVQDFISMAFYCINCNPWLILLLVLAIIPSFFGESYFNSKNYALSRSQTQKEENWITCVIWELVTKLQRKWRSLGYRILSLVVLKHFLINFIATIANWQYAGQFGTLFCIRHFGLLCRLRIYHLWNCYRKIVWVVLLF
jgi:hypothetical protein